MSFLMIFNSIIICYESKVKHKINLCKTNLMRLTHEITVVLLNISANFDFYYLVMECTFINSGI